MDPRFASEVAALATWIKDGFERARVQRLELDLRSATGETCPVSAWMTDDFEGKDPEELAEAILNEAHKDAQHQRGTTRYQVLGFKDGEELHFMRRSFRLPGGNVQPAMVILDHLAVSPAATLLVRMTRHVVGLFGCAAEAIERTSSWVASSARTFSEGGDVRYQRGD
jgi:hypothetical protein